MDCTADVVDVLAAHPARFAPHLHLPLQHAADAVLARMARPYTIEAYASLVDEVRRRLPHAAIGSDVIVGFPGETEAEFEALASYLEASPDRPGTAASALPGKVPGAVVKARAQRLRAISRQLSAAFRARQVGSVRPALTLEDGRVAVTDNYLRVPVPPGRTRNEWILVPIPAEAVDGAPS
jgi:tRNA A37 methylthiotransferase MiaB